MIAWLLLNDVEILCNRSWRILEILLCSCVIFSFAFFQLFENLTFLASLRCSSLIQAVCLSVSIGFITVLSDKVRNLFTPKSPPTMLLEPCLGTSTSCSTWTETNQCCPFLDPVTFLALPRISRDFLKLTQPILGKKTRLSLLLTLNPCGKENYLIDAVFLNVGMYFRGCFGSNPSLNARSSCFNVCCNV